MSGFVFWIRPDGDPKNPPPGIDKCRKFLIRRGPRKHISNVLQTRSHHCIGREVSFLKQDMWIDMYVNGNLLLNGMVTAGSLDYYSKMPYGVPATLARLRGSYSVIYFEPQQKKLWFAKDCLGRCSLLMKLNHTDVILSSTMSKAIDGAIEIPEIGIFVFDLETSSLSVYPWGLPDAKFERKVEDLNTMLGIKLTILESVFQESRDISNLQLVPKPSDILGYGEILFTAQDEDHDQSESQGVDIKKHPDIIDTEAEKMSLECLVLKEGADVMDRRKIDHVLDSLLKKPEVREKVQEVLSLLRESIRLSITFKSICCHECRYMSTCCMDARMGILFSGGLKSTILAAVASELQPRYNDEPRYVDLINVAFESTREVDSSSTRSRPVFWGANFDSPDRRSSMEALAELKEALPNKNWKLFECNIRRIEIQTAREEYINHLVYPDTSDSGSNLGCILWFASRGHEIKREYREPCKSTSSTLLIGMGADELFGGCARHRKTLQTGGWAALTEELNEELQNVSELKLPVVNRVVCDHGRRPVFPYLDENLIEYVRGLNAWERCFPTESMPDGLGDKLLLRLVARELGLRKTASAPSRSMVIGSGFANTDGNSS